MRYVAALRDGRGLVWMSEDGLWLPQSAFRLRHGQSSKTGLPHIFVDHKPRAFNNPASAIEVASEFARRLGCGWRVEMVP